MGDTPVWDAVRAYRDQDFLRLHMPGHKGKGKMESLDLTEVTGLDPLYSAKGVIRESEEIAAELFGAGRTLYSAEGSSLCIRAMIFLVNMRARQRGIRPLVLAGRNAHRSFLSAIALMGMEVRWLRGRNLLTCKPEAEELLSALDALGEVPAAVYLTSPDYLGHRADIAPLAAICHDRGIPLLVDNAHGAYLRFLPADAHPLSLGADLICDSAHKTLPVLTGGAYLHVHREADACFFSQADRAMALFASTSPSWLILQSLDRCNAYLKNEYPDLLAAFLPRVDACRDDLRKRGFAPAGEEPLKITLMPKSYGYSGTELHQLLRARKIECEFADPDFLVMMVTPEMGAEGLDRLEEALAEIPRRAPLLSMPPEPPEGEMALPPAAAMLAPAETVPVKMSLGRILADPCASCPPAIPILISGERITPEAIRCFTYYGMETVSCVL